MTPIIDTNPTRFPAWLYMLIVAACGLFIFAGIFLEQIK